MNQVISWKTRDNNLTESLPSTIAYSVRFQDTMDPSDPNKAFPCNRLIFLHVSCIVEWYRTEIDNATISCWSTYSVDSTTSIELYRRILCNKLIFPHQKIEFLSGIYNELTVCVPDIPDQVVCFPPRNSPAASQSNTVWYFRRFAQCNGHRTVVSSERYTYLEDSMLYQTFALSRTWPASIPLNALTVPANAARRHPDLWAFEWVIDVSLIPSRLNFSACKVVPVPVVLPLRIFNWIFRITRCN